MTPAETILAAIDKLTDQRREASTGPWVAWRRQTPGFYPRGVTFGVEDARGTDITGRTGVADASLIHTLHATIGAQLLIMRNELEEIAIDKEASGAERPPHHDVFTLAQAILGEQVDA